MKNKSFEGYISRMADIRQLSSPDLEGIENADDYSRRLRENFKKIGLMAKENRDFLDERIFPLTESEELLSEEMVETIRTFNDELVDHMEVEYLDSAIMALLSDRLMRDAEEKGDTTYRIHQLLDRVVVCHTFMYMTSRIRTNPSISGHFREEGLKAAEEMMSYLPHETFKTLSDEAKENVLMVNRFHTTLMGSASGITEEMAEKWLEALKNAWVVYDDPFYRENTKDYNWDYYRYRTHEYYSSILDYLLGLKLSEDKLKRIRRHVEKQVELYETDPEKFESYSMYDMLRVSLYQSRYLCGDLSKEEYLQSLRTLYNGRNKTAYDFDNLFINLRCPADMIMTMAEGEMSEKEKALTTELYHEALDYAFLMKNGGTLSEFLELYTPLLFHFKEIPGELTFEEFCLHSLAALHPPTYVHSMMVASLSRCIVKHLLLNRPELFIGMPGIKTKKEAMEKKDEIMEFTYHAALCHDFGKLPIIDTVFIYGRRLLDFEFDIIKQHPDLGMDLMEKSESTKAYTDIARGHHKWYDDSQGYPEHFETKKSPYKTIIDVVTCADCMDAATDSIGRSYNAGKTFEDFEKDLSEGSGTRYAPYLSELFQDPAARKDILYLLDDGRRLHYRNTYLLLRELQKMAE